jgi:hypothetical protein
LSVEIDGVLEQHRSWVQDLSELSKQHYSSYRAYEPIRTSTKDEGMTRKLTPQEKKDLAEAKKYQALNQERDLDLKWTALERNCSTELLAFIKEERRERKNRLTREKRQNVKRLLAPATWEDTIRAGL